MKLNTPITVKNMTLNTRLVMPPMATERAGAGGTVSDRTVAYYDEKAADGALGLIITEHVYILPQGKASPNQGGMDSDDKIEGHRRLTDAVHKHGVKIAAQISHAGGRTLPKITGEPTVAPSLGPIGSTAGGEKAMTKEDIRAVVAAFAAAARRVREAGFDAVEIHSAHGYLLDQFYSPLSNHREDEYGGSLENRVRIHLEVIKAVREAVGEDFPILLRLGACDYLEGGATVEDAVAAAAAFEKAGVDLLDISGGLSGYMVKVRETLQGYFAEESAAVKKAVGIPVLVTGGVTQAQAAEDLLESGAADLVGVGRATLKNSHWAKEALESLGLN